MDRTIERQKKKRCGASPREGEGRTPLIQPCGRSPGHHDAGLFETMQAPRTHSSPLRAGDAVQKSSACGLKRFAEASASQTAPAAISSPPSVLSEVSFSLAESGLELGLWTLRIAVTKWRPSVESSLLRKAHRLGQDTPSHGEPGFESRWVTTTRFSAGCLYPERNTNHADTAPTASGGVCAPAPRGTQVRVAYHTKRGHGSEQHQACGGRVSCDGKWAPLSRGRDPATRPRETIDRVQSRLAGRRTGQTQVAK